MRRTIARLALALLALCSGDAVVAQTNVENPADPYVQTQTGMAFPAHIAGSVRHQVVRYTEDGSDSGIGYQVVRDDRMVAYVSMFVYPAPALTQDSPAARDTACAALFEGIKRDILSHEAAAKLVAETTISAPSPQFKKRGFRVVYTGGRGKFDGTEQEVREQGDLFCFAGGKWLVAYRVTMPAGIDATAEVDALLRALTWPASLGD